MTAKISVYKMYNLQFHYQFFSVLEKGIKIFIYIKHMLQLLWI